MNIIKTIRAEIVHRLELFADIKSRRNPSPFTDGAIDALSGILYFIDTRDEDPILSSADLLISAVERYVQPKPGDKYCSRSELLNTKDNLKALLK